MLSTIILNWNRSDLLKRTIESYFDTVKGPYELLVVDNASTDDSATYLKGLEVAGKVRVIYLDQNIGGIAYNQVLPLTRGDLVHLSENDQEFLPGWSEHVEASFDAFAELGQLSLFSDTPTDNEAWEPKPSHLRFTKGKILYEAHGNVGTSSVLRATLFRERRLRIRNIELGRFKFPDDAELSVNVKAAGYWCGWSDRYYVRNLGHEIAEFEAREEYYRENYASKPWVGVSGWKQRIENQRALPKAQRQSHLFPDRAAVPEKTREPVFGKAARLWSMLDGWTAELETLEFLFALTRLIKPTEVIETGTWLGISSCAIGRALSANGIGHLTTLEINPEAHVCATQNIEHYGLSSVITAVLIPSLEFIPDRTCEMAVFDSEISLRGAEFRRFRPYLADYAIVVFHDAAPHHKTVFDEVRSLMSEGLLDGVDLPTPRGVFIGRVRPITK